MLRWLGCLSLAATLATHTLEAYSLNGKTWASGDIRIQLSLGNAPFTLSDGNTSWNAAAAPVLDMWNQQVGRIHLTGVMNSSAPAASGDGVNSVVFSSTVFGQSFGTGTLAVCYYMMQGSNLIEADVLFNVAQTFDSYRGPLRYSGAGGYATGDIRRVFLHELGHGLGLNHAGGDIIMAPITGNRETLASDDIAGIQAMYGPPAPAPTPTPTPPPTNGSHVPSDFNTDSKQDIVWQNNLTGQRAIWLMNGSAYAEGRSLPTVGTVWQIAATGDFNLDGHADLVWQNSQNGERVVWFMSGTTFLGQSQFATIATVWQIVSTGDFNSDGRVDLVWQNTVSGQRVIWLMNGTSMMSDVYLPTVETVWKIVGTDDFNSDTKVDIVWQNTLTGQRVVWLMNGSTRISDHYLPTVSTEWMIAGTGEFNGDGRTDILWQNTLTGQRYIWFMNGINKVGDQALSAVSTEWEIRNH